MPRYERSYIGAIEMVKLSRAVPVDHSGRAKTNVHAMVGFDIPILVHETFDNPVTGWTTTGNAGDYWAGRSLDAAYFEAFGYRMKTRATAPAANDWVQIAKEFAISTLQEIIVSGFFKVTNPAAEIKELTMLAKNQTSGILGTAGVKYVPADSKWYYINSSGGYTEFLADSDVCEDHWHHSSIISNTTSSYYGLATIDGHEIDLTTAQVFTTPNPGVVDSFTVEYKIVASGATTVQTDIDNIIVRYT